MFLGPEGRKQLQAAGTVSAVGLELAASIAIGFFGGTWLDTKLGTEPYIQWIGFGFGLAAGYRSLYRLARKHTSTTPKDPPAPS